MLVHALITCVHYSIAHVCIIVHVYIISICKVVNVILVEDMQKICNERSFVHMIVLKFVLPYDI